MQKKEKRRSKKKSLTQAHEENHNEILQVVSDNAVA